MRSLWEPPDSVNRMQYALRERGLPIRGLRIAIERRFRYFPPARRLPLTENDHSATVKPTPIVGGEWETK